MAVYQIVKKGNRVLREKARPVKKVNDTVLKLLDNLADTLYDAEGVGLAAPQIGISKRVIVVDIGEGIIELINPEVIAGEGEATDLEGCLSIPSVQGLVSRHAKIKVRGINREGDIIEIEATGLLARALQHEIDHLEGILFTDKVTEYVK